jgi:hypothetical protein
MLNMAEVGELAEELVAEPAEEVQINILAQDYNEDNSFHKNLF